MAKAKKSFEDLDNELAALEAELAQLEGKPKKIVKPAAPGPAARAPEPPAAAASPEPAVAPPAEEAPKKRGFKLPLKKTEKAAPAPAPAPASSDPRPAPSTPAARSSPAPVADPSLWRRENDAWIRTVPGRAPIVRRILDENGVVVREEPADARDLDGKSDVRAERGAGKLLGRFRR